jgi:hypothetical protein
MRAVRRAVGMDGTRSSGMIMITQAGLTPDVFSTIDLTRPVTAVPAE